MEWLSDPDAWSALAALLLLEVVLGVDNVIFISILASKLPEGQQDRARKTGLLAAGGMRVLLLLAVGWIISLKSELFTLFDLSFSGKDLILLAGGVFLIWKATKEIHAKLEGEEHHASDVVAPTFASVIGQVLLLDAVFSVDSVITAVGMTEYVVVMVIAVLTAVFSVDSVITAVGMTEYVVVMVIAVLTAVVIMLVASKSIYEFVNRHPTVKMLALSFLLLIGVTLIAEGLGQKIPKGYIYSAIAFAVLVEMLNIRMTARKRAKGAAGAPVQLHQQIVPDPDAPVPV